MKIVKLTELLAIFFHAPLSHSWHRRWWFPAACDVLSSRHPARKPRKPEVRVWNQESRWLKTRFFARKFHRDRKGNYGLSDTSFDPESPNDRLPWVLLDRPTPFVPSKAHEILLALVRDQALAGAKSNPPGAGTLILGLESYSRIERNGCLLLGTFPFRGMGLDTSQYQLGEDIDLEVISTAPPQSNYPYPYTVAKPTPSGHDEVLRFA